MTALDLGSRVVDRGLALALASAINVGLTTLWLPLMVPGIAVVVFVGNRFLLAVLDIVDAAERDHSGRRPNDGE